jgi:hypothetical protein
MRCCSSASPGDYTLERNGRLGREVMEAALATCAEAARAPAGIKRVLVGHSLGAACAAAEVIAHPEVCRAASVPCSGHPHGLHADASDGQWIGGEHWGAVARAAACTVSGPIVLVPLRKLWPGRNSRGMVSGASLQRRHVRTCHAVGGVLCGTLRTALSCLA